MIISVRQLASALTPRGYVRFYNIRPDRKRPEMWFCDECGERVTTSLQPSHAKHHS